MPGSPPPEGAGGRAWLGIAPGPVPPEVRAQVDLEPGVGVAVREVPGGTPAARAGLRRGDLIIRMDDHSVDGVPGLMRLLAGARPGQKVELEILRKGKREHLAVELGGD